MGGIRRWGIVSTGRNLKGSLPKIPVWDSGENLSGAGGAYLRCVPMGPIPPICSERTPACPDSEWVPTARLRAGTLATSRLTTSRSRARPETGALVEFSGERGCNYSDTYFW